jgi:cation diffusion facilitator family transporter
MSASSGSLKTILFALGANTAIALAKSAAAVVTGSGAMFAEAIHSTADAGNQVLLLLGVSRSRKPPSADAPLGYGKEIYFWSFIVALMLFSVGGLVSINEGLHKLQHPEPLSHPYIAIGVLVFALFAEGAALRACLHQVNKTRGTQPLWRWFRESRQSELMVIFGEDLAALVGLSLALLAITATLITGDPMYDALGSCAIGVLLVLVAILVGREVKELLVGQGVEPRVRAAMQQFLEEQPEVSGLFNVLTLQMGDDVMVAIKAEMADPGSAVGVCRSINAVEARFREAFPQVTWLFFEPDIRD